MAYLEKTPTNYQNSLISHLELSVTPSEKKEAFESVLKTSILIFFYHCYNSLSYI